MSKNEILNEMYNYAIKNGLCNSKKSFATLIGISPTNYSKVFADTNERFCTLNVLVKANNALNNVFSPQYLMTGTGDMYAQAQVSAADTDTTPLSLAEDKPKIDLIGHLEYTIEVQKKLIEKLEKENDALKKANTHASASVKNA